MRPQGRPVGREGPVPRPGTRRSANGSRNTSAVEVKSISPHGFSLLLDERELFVPFDEFPWFRDASVANIYALERPRPEHLRWPALDVDPSVASINDPSAFPLMSKLRGNDAPNRTDDPKAPGPIADSR